MRYIPSVVFLLLAACSSQTGTSSSIRLEPNPPRVGVMTTVHVRMPPITGPVSIEADMTHPGMEPLTATATPEGTGGEYKGQIDLDMAGDWIIQVKAQSTDGRPVVQQLNVTVSNR